MFVIWRILSGKIWDIHHTIFRIEFFKTLQLSFQFFSNFFWRKRINFNQKEEEQNYSHKYSQKIPNNFLFNPNNNFCKF